MFRSLAEAVRAAESQGTTLAAIALRAEAEDSGRPVADIREALGRALAVIRAGVDHRRRPPAAHAAPERPFAHGAAGALTAVRR